MCALILCWSAQEPRAPTLVPHIAPVALQQDERNYQKPGKTQNCRPRCSLVGQELLVEAAADDKKHPFSLEKLGVNNICATEDVSVFANRGTVVSHSPEVGASPARSRLPGTARPRLSGQRERRPRLPARGRSVRGPADALPRLRTKSRWLLERVVTMQFRSSWTVSVRLLGVRQLTTSTSEEAKTRRSNWELLFRITAAF